MDTALQKRIYLNLQWIIQSLLACDNSSLRSWGNFMADRMSWLTRGNKLTVWFGDVWQFHQKRCMLRGGNRSNKTESRWMWLEPGEYWLAIAWLALHRKVGFECNLFLLAMKLLYRMAKQFSYDTLSTGYKLAWSPLKVTISLLARSACL